MHQIKGGIHMRAIISLKEGVSKEFITSMNVTVLNELSNIPRLIDIEAEQEALDDLYISEYVEHVTHEAELKQKIPVIDKNYKMETSSLTWYYSALRVSDYWERGLTGKGIKVAILDYAIGNHYSLDISGGATFGENEGVEGDYTQPASYFTDYRDRRHGTQCASLVGGKPIAESSSGVIGGTAPDASIYGVKIVGEVGTDMPGAVDWCIENGIDIISYSASSEGHPLLDGVMWQSAMDAGILVVCSAGNSNAPIGATVYPTCMDDAVSISGMTKTFTRHTYQYGSPLKFVAPAVGIANFDYLYGAGNIASTFVTGVNGTSFATPMIAGIFALYKQAFPNLTNKELVEMVANSARKISNAYWEQYVGFGLPQPSKEIMALPRLINGNGLVFKGNGDYIDCGQDTSLNLVDKITLSATIRQDYRNTGHIFAKANSNGSSIFYGMLLAADGMYAEWRRGTTQEKMKQVRSVADGQIHTVVFVYDYPSIRMYVDGKLLKQSYSMSANMVTSGTNDKLYIGSNNGTSTGSFSGVVYDVKVYNRALTDSEIVSDYEGTILQEGLQLHYSFTGQEQGTVLDLSGKGNDGVIYGARAYKKPISQTRSVVKPLKTIESAQTGERTRQIAPLEVTNLSFTSTDHTVRLAWTGSKTPSVKYDIYQAGVGFKALATTTSNNYTISSLDASTDYEFIVKTVGSKGNSSPGVKIIATTAKDTTSPNEPSNLVSLTDESTAMLKWTASTSTDMGSYDVRIGVAGSPLSETTVVETNIPRTTYMITGLNPNTSYDAWVVAKDKAGNISSGISTSITTKASNSVIISDDFNRENSTELGTPWVYGTNNKFGIIDGQAYPSTTASWIQPASLSFEAPNYFIEMDIIKHGKGVNLYLQMATDFMNSHVVRKNLVTGTWMLIKLKDGMVTPYNSKNLYSDGSITTTIPCRDGDKLRAESYGDGRIRAFVNGELIIDEYDYDFLSTTQKAGFSMFDAEGRIDNFKIGQISI